MAQKQDAEGLMIAAPNYKVMETKIIGVAPYVQHKVDPVVIDGIKKKQEEGASARNKKDRKPRDFQNAYKQAIHFSEEGWPGIPVNAIRGAMIAACRATPVAMTTAKAAIVAIEPDGYDKTEGCGLVRFFKGAPEYSENWVRVGGGMSVVARPRWAPGWEAIVRIRFDADMLATADVMNLLARAGMQVGIGEGRPATKASDAPGMGWGLFRVAEDGE